MDWILDKRRITYDSTPLHTHSANATLERLVSATNYKPLWNKTTDKYKKFNLIKLRKYTYEETGRDNVDGKYRRLYNKYVKNKML